MSLPLNRLRVMETSGNDPVSLEDVRLHLRLDNTEEEEYLRSLVTAAGTICESYTGLSLLWTRYVVSLDQWPDTAGSTWWDGVREGAASPHGPLVLSLPRPPLMNINEIRVFDKDDVVTVVSPEDYFVDAMGLPGRVIFKKGAHLPVPGRLLGGIEIDYNGGYGTKSDSLPAALKQGIRLIVGHLYENRGDSPENALQASGAKTIFQPFRLMRLT